MDKIWKSFFVTTPIFMVSFSAALGQGAFSFWNPGAPTYVGVLGGAVAGPGIYGQALVGLTTNSLAPLGVPIQHNVNGIVTPQAIGVDFAPTYSYVQVQMAVWNGTVWGTNFSNVPGNQFGFTDIVPVQIVFPTDAFWDQPHFLQSAVVPFIPEPSTSALFILTACAVVLSRRLPSGGKALRTCSEADKDHEEQKPIRGQ